MPDQTDLSATVCAQPALDQTGVFLFKTKLPWNLYRPNLTVFKAAIDRSCDNITTTRDAIAAQIIGAFHFIVASNPQAPQEDGHTSRSRNRLPACREKT
jgi:hypothetical protein